MKIKRNKLKLGIFVIGILLMISLVSAAYSRSNPNYGSFDTFVGDTPGFDRDYCEAGQDFIVQIAPFGCTPAVVRSDLLEEQNVPVFCQLAATNINPLIDVKAIESISFSGQYPKEVSGVGFHPAKAALGVEGDLSSPILNNIGYVVIVLKKQEIESEMPDFVQGNLTAKISYDIKNAFGIGKATFYLHEIEDEDWDSKDIRAQYSFWSGRGYLRADSIDVDGATISVYDDIRKISSVSLEKGETSREIYMPGFDCLATLELRLDGFEVPDTRVKLDINGELVEVAEGERFLDNKCRVTSINKIGIVKEVEIRCDTDDKKGEKINLKISPKVKLKIGDEEKDFEVGEKMPFQGNDPNKYVYLGYIGTKKDSGKKEDLYVRFVQTPYHGERLTDDMISEVARYDSGGWGQEGGTVKKIFGFFGEASMKFVERFARYLVQGTEISGILEYSKPDKVYGTQVTLVDFSGAQNAEFSEKLRLEKQLERLNEELKTQKDEKLSKELGAEYGPLPDLEEINQKIIDKEKEIESIKEKIKEAAEFEGRVKENYDNAMKDYDRVIDSFPNERCGEITCGEEALYLKMLLALYTDQKKTLFELCQVFEENYPESKKNLRPLCENIEKLSSSEVSIRDVMINNQVKRISFEGIYEPSREEYSVDITITNADKDCTGGILGKDDYTCFSGSEVIKLKELNEDYALFDVSSVQESAGKETFWKTSDLRIDLEDFKVIGKKNYQIRVNKINLKKLAKVSVIPNINNAGTEANFGFKVGIEKRAIQLSPEQIKDKINNLDKTIAEWQDKSDKLGSVVKGLKTACLATGAYLTVKNFFANVGGKGIARQQVMTGEGGWNDICANAINTGKIGDRTVNYKSLDECFTKEADSINKDVDSYYNALSKQNDEIKALQEGCEGETKFLGETVINTACFKDKLVSDSYKNELKENCGGEIDVGGGQKVPCADIVDRINVNTSSVEQLRRIQLNSRDGSNMAKAQLQKDLKDLYVNTQNEAELSSIMNEAIGAGFKDVDISWSADKDTVKETYNGVKVSGAKISGITGLDEKKDYNIKIQGYGSKKYLFLLDKGSGSTYGGTAYEFKGFSEGKINVGEKDDVVSKKFIYTLIDENSYSNAFKSVAGETGPIVQFYETEPYKGYPALVPFDLKNGWYAATRQTLPVLGGIKSYDESGRVTSVWLCNVGEDRVAGFKSEIGDDICEMVNLGTGQPYNVFPGLDKSETSKLVGCAVEAILDASKQHESGVREVGISTKCGGSISVKVGKPAVDIPEMQCQNFMSPKECQLLFNVCDPVICPSSRCDLGGAYPVTDVIQSGIIGSIALCLPNFREGIYIPVCLTGIQAGIDGYLSVVKAHRDCLQESLDTGKTVGICDEIYSINLCEFFWRQGLPFAKLILPKMIEWAMGQNVRGGGEYLSVMNAWNNADQSITYFTQYYAANAYAAFKARTAEEVGGEVCKSFVSGVYPEGGNLLDSLTEPDSPPQFHGRFDELPFTSATVPPISHYKVFYHIYAGKDSGAYYQVYLKAGPESSFYQDTSYRRIVDSGYIVAGEYASETIDFTAPSGYKEMCIRVNEQEECGFKQVSTSYAVNYVEDKYMEEQASQTDITSETECIAGTASAYSLLSPNIQEGVDEVINPAIYERGIIRICATDNPGKGTDPYAGTGDSRWVEVGYCDNEKIKCWLDRESVSDVIKDFEIENETLQKLTENQLKILEEEGNYEKKEVIDETIKNLNTILFGDFYPGICEDVISGVNEIIDKTFWNNQKAELHILRGRAYSNLALEKKREVQTQTSEAESTTTAEPEKETEVKPVEGGEVEEYCTKYQCEAATSKSSGLVVSGKCHEELGKRIMEIAKSKKTSNSMFNDETIQQDTGGKAKSFECLVLQLAIQESCLAHCIYEEGKTSYKYCDEIFEKVVKGDNDNSIGVMQINIDAHPSMKTKAFNFEDNVEYGINYLISLYEDTTKSYGCNGQNYHGWELALRRYNGWFPNDCNKGDKNYVENVENVLSKKARIANLFPECRIEASGGETSTETSPGQIEENGEIASY